MFEAIFSNPLIWFLLGTTLLVIGIVRRTHSGSVSKSESANLVSLLDSANDWFFTRYVGVCPKCNVNRYLNEKIYLLSTHNQHEKFSFNTGKDSYDFQADVCTDYTEKFSTYHYYSTHCPSCRSIHPIFETTSEFVNKFRYREKGNPSEEDFKGKSIQPPTIDEYGPAVMISGEMRPFLAETSLTFSSGKIKVSPYYGWGDFVTGTLPGLHTWLGKNGKVFPTLMSYRMRLDPSFKTSVEISANRSVDVGEYSENHFSMIVWGIVFLLVGLLTLFV